MDLHEPSMAGGLLQGNASGVVPDPPAAAASRSDLGRAPYRSATPAGQPRDPTLQLAAHERGALPPAEADQSDRRQGHRQVPEVQLVAQEPQELPMGQVDPEAGAGDGHDPRLEEA